jgi:hypothetical protein
MKLYKVTVSFEMGVLAKSREQAYRIAVDNVRDELDAAIHDNFDAIHYPVLCDDGKIEGWDETSLVYHKDACQWDVPLYEAVKISNDDYDTVKYMEEHYEK